MLVEHINGTPVVFVPNLKKGEWKFQGRWVFVGHGTNLDDLKKSFADFDAKFLKDNGICPLDSQ